MNTLAIRAVSAVVAVLFLCGVVFWGGHWGYEFIISIAVFGGGLELTRILFHKNEPLFLRISFYVFVALIYLLSCLVPVYSALVFATFSVLYCLMSLTFTAQNTELKDIVFLQAKSILGFFYLGLLPFFAHQLVNLLNGPIWFLTLLAVVFAGDIGAYLVGVSVGKKRIMPTVSPKKSLEGSLGGIVFSIVAILICNQFLHQNPLAMTALGFSAAVVGQFGDLFESLLKRVAEVKDSGRIMPGHGGILDRIDGVLFASPVVLFGALILQQTLI